MPAPKNDERYLVLRTLLSAILSGSSVYLKTPASSMGSENGHRISYLLYLSTMQDQGADIQSPDDHAPITEEAPPRPTAPVATCECGYPLMLEQNCPECGRSFFEAISNLRLCSYTTPQVKRLLSHSSSIQTLCVLWCIGAVVAAILVVGLLSSGVQNEEDMILAIFAIPMLALQIFAIVGGFKRSKWGRTVGMIACALMLINIPCGTLIGILGLIAYGGGSVLFGPGRITQAELKKEVAFRKKHRIKLLPPLIPSHDGDPLRPPDEPA